MRERVYYSNVELEACPWCGTTPIVYRYTSDGGFIVACTCPRCPVTPYTDTRKTPKSAAAIWNRRRP